MDIFVNMTPFAALVTALVYLTPPLASAPFSQWPKYFDGVQYGCVVL